jgi:hypothetical protein
LAELLGQGGDLGKIAGSLTIRELTSGRSSKRSPTRRGSADPRKAAGAKIVDTKTPAGRAAYDSAVLKVFKAKRGEISATEIRAR